VGRIDLTVKPRNGVTVLDRLHQSGPLRVRLVRVERNTATTAILLNTGGGVTGGDSHRIEITAQAGTALTLSSQGAERVYRAAPGDLPARMSSRITIADMASVEYLPQETILFDRSALNRRLRIELIGTARYVGVESLIFGRAAMGETIQTLDLTDTIEIYRNGTLMFRDALRPPRRFAAARSSRTMFGGAGGVATILFASPDAAKRLDAVRAALNGAHAGATAWNGLLLIRVLAQTGVALRETILGVLAVLRDGAPMPRVWEC
jgi:urease accessory protein